jgi:hypothetical protein
MATSGDRYLATSGDFFMATDRAFSTCLLPAPGWSLPLGRDGTIACRPGLSGMGVGLDERVDGRPTRPLLPSLPRVGPRGPSPGGCPVVAGRRAGLGHAWGGTAAGPLPHVRLGGLAPPRAPGSGGGGADAGVRGRRALGPSTFPAGFRVRRGGHELLPGSPIRRPNQTCSARYPC